MEKKVNPKEQPIDIDLLPSGLRKEIEKMQQSILETMRIANKPSINMFIAEILKNRELQQTLTPTMNDRLQQIMEAEAKKFLDIWEKEKPTITKLEKTLREVAERIAREEESTRALEPYVKVVNSRSIDLIVDLFTKKPNDEMDIDFPIVKDGKQIGTETKKILLTRHRKKLPNGDIEGVIAWVGGALSGEGENMLFQTMMEYDPNKPDLAEFFIKSYVDRTGRSYAYDITKSIKQEVGKLRSATIRILDHGKKKSPLHDQEFNLIWGSNTPEKNKSYPSNKVVLYLTPFTQVMFREAGAYLYLSRLMVTVDKNKYRYARRLLKVFMWKKGLQHGWENCDNHKIADLLEEAEFPKLEYQAIKKDDQGSAIIDADGNHETETKRLRNPKQKIIIPFIENMNALSSVLTYEYVKGGEANWKEFSTGEIRVSWIKHPQENEVRPPIQRIPKPDTKRRRRGKKK